MAAGTKSGTSKPRSDVPFLEQTAGTGWGRSFELSRKKLSIGRTTDNEIVLDSTSVSRVHAVLKQTPKGWFIEDNISKNGIWVNGIAVKKALLKPGDVIQVGEFVFRFCDPTMLAAPKTELSRSHGGNKTEVLSTDTWNVVPESTPQKPPIEKPQSQPQQQSQSISPSQSQQPSQVQSQSSYTTPMGQIQQPNPMTSTGSRLRPRTTGPREPLKLVSFGKGNQERLYLIMGLVGGLLVGCLLYLRIQKPATPPAAIIALKPSKNAKSEASTRTVAPQEAFRQIAEKSVEEEPEEQQQQPPSTPKMLQKAAEDAKRPGIRPEEMQLGMKGKKQRAANKDISVYLSEGKSYLHDGDFESAMLAYRFALVIDPNNANAKAGLAAAQQRKRSISVDDTVVKATRESKPKGKTESKAEKNAERKSAVLKLLKSASESLKKRRYQEAIGTAEKVRQIEISGETAYLNEAKQIIDRSEQRQKEEFEPFVELARKKMSEGDYRGSILLCEEMLRTDPGYAPAKECMERSTAGLAVTPSAPKAEGVK